MVKKADRNSYSIHKLTKYPKLYILGVFVLIGLITLLLTNASTFSTVIEPETGSLSTTGNAKVLSNVSDASGGKAIKFGQASNDGDLLSNFFPIGTFISPDYDFAKWKARGVNTIVEPPQGTTPGPWAAKAKDQGLFVIAPQSVGSGSNVMAWNHPDEPDGIYTQRPYTEIQQNYNLWKSINPNMPVYVNLIGQLNQYDTKTGEGGGKNWYQKYMAGADWISGDVYPKNQGFSMTEVGTMVDKLRDWSGDKPVFAFIESSDINSADNLPGPTPAEMRAQIWSAIIHGVRGYWFFAPRIAPSFSFDATPGDVAAEMTAQNAKVKSLTQVLQGDINPTGISASASSPMEFGWRNHSSGKYFFALNLSNSTRNNQQINLTGIGDTSSAEVYQEGRSVGISNGKITDNFAPYAVHIYKVQ